MKNDEAIAPLMVENLKVQKRINIAYWIRLEFRIFFLWFWHLYACQNIVYNSFNKNSFKLLNQYY